MKNLFKSAVLFVVAFSMFVISGCAGASLAVKPDEMVNLKGLTTEAVVAKLGKPDRKYTDSNGNQVWEYKTPAADQEGRNAYMRIGSFGFLSGRDSMYVDILRLTFYKGAVANYAFEENVTNISMPGMGGTQTPPPPAMPVTNVSHQKVVKEKPAPQPVEEKVQQKVVEQKVEAGSFPVSTIENTRNFSGKAGTIFNKLVSGAGQKGFKIIESKKGTRLVVVNAEGNKIGINLKQGKKDVVVKLSSTGSFSPVKMLDDFDSLYQSCQ
jgi:hypothetical protein